MEDMKSVDALVVDTKELLNAKTCNVKVEITNHGTRFQILLDGHKHTSGSLSSPTNPQDLLDKIKPNVPSDYNASHGTYLGAGYVSFRLNQQR